MLPGSTEESISSPNNLKEESFKFQELPLLNFKSRLSLSLKSLKP
jgi:hypothetical protein